MSTPRFPPNPFTDIVPRRGATSSKAGLDTYRRLAALEQGVGANTSVDVDGLGLYRALGSSIIAYTFDPGDLGSATANSFTIDSGVIYVGAVYVPSPATITGVTTYTQTPGVGTWTLAKTALYDIGGNRVAQSASATDAWKLAALSSGFYNRDFSSAYDADRGLYYAAVLNVRSATTTAPKLAGRTAFASGLQSLRTASSFPRVRAFTGQTDMPATLTLSGGTALTTSRWMGLY